MPIIFRATVSCDQKSSPRIERNCIQIAWSVGAIKANENRKSFQLNLGIRGKTRFLSPKIFTIN
jgi:hypothetical protein